MPRDRCDPWRRESIRLSTKQPNRRSRLWQKCPSRGTASAAVCLDVRSRHILAHVLAVSRVLLEENFKIALHHPGELRARKPLPELGCANRAFCQGVLQLLGVSGDVWIGVGRQFVDAGEVRVPVERIRNSLVKNFLLTLFVSIKPAFVGLLVIIVEQVGLNQLIYKRRHRAQRIFSGHRRPDAQRELLNGLLICDVLGRPWLQVPRRLLRGIGRALRYRGPGSDRRSLGLLARGLLAFASGDDAARESNDFFRIVAAHRRPRRGSRFSLTCALLLTAASPAFAARSMALARSCSSQARASCPRWITSSIGWSLPTN